MLYIFYNLLFLAEVAGFHPRLLIGLVFGVGCGNAFHLSKLKNYLTFALQPIFAKKLTVM